MSRIVPSVFTVLALMVLVASCTREEQKGAAAPTATVGAAHFCTTATFCCGPRPRVPRSSRESRCAR